MAYVNGLRSFGHRSRLAAAREISKRKVNPLKNGRMPWQGQGVRFHFAEKPRDYVGHNNEYEQAEIIAKSGVEELMER